MSKRSRKAYVVFTGKTDMWFLRFLKIGFRHCFILLKDQDHWLSIDPLLSHTEIEIIPNNKDLLLPEWFSSQGFLVVESYFQSSKTNMAPLALMNCVETIKRILGIHDFMIFTPYQLFKHLTENEEKNHGKLI